jgi:hypothetical protein
MLDWLNDFLTAGAEPTVGSLAKYLLISLLFGAVIAVIYVVTQRRTRSELISFATTIVLLTVLISMVTLVIGNNIARAFSLAGALAIIRFRTVVEDTRDTAFVIFAVVVGMAVGANMITIPLVGTPIVAGAALVLSRFGHSTPADMAEYTLAIRLSLGRDPSEHLKQLFGKHLADARLRATTTARQGAALDLTYLVRLRPDRDPVAFVTELNQMEGVQSAELRQLGI